MSGFGHKGEGKHANYGTHIPPPSVVPPDELDALVAQGTCIPGQQQPGSSAAAAAAPPDPMPVSSAEVEGWINGSFRPLSNLSTKMPPEVGESILWRGVKSGRSGQPSTQCEYFNGKVRHLMVDSQDELWLFVD